MSSELSVLEKLQQKIIQLQTVVGHLQDHLDRFEDPESNLLFSRPFHNLSARNFQKILRNPKLKFQMLDVSEKGASSEFFDGNPKKIALEELEERWTDIDPTLPVVVFCKWGDRSLEACELLSKKGLINVNNLRGGYTRCRELLLQ